MSGVSALVESLARLRNRVVHRQYNTATTRHTDTNEW